MKNRTAKAAATKPAGRTAPATKTTKVDIRMHGKAHSVRLDTAIWNAFRKLADECNVTLGELATIAQRDHNGGLADAITAYVRKNSIVPLHATRELWVSAIVDSMRPEFARRGYPLPEKVRATIAFTSKGWRGKRRGECWSPDMSGDGATEVMVCLREKDAIHIGNILTHELVHAAQFLEAKNEGKKVKNGHDRRFKKIADAMDITVGKGTHALGDPKGAWGEWAIPLIEAAGPMPHSAIAEHVAKEKKQTTRMLKCECPDCGAIWRTSKKVLEVIAEKQEGRGEPGYLNCVDPDCTGIIHIEDILAGGEGGDEPEEVPADRQMLTPRNHPLRKAEEASVKRGKRFSRQAAAGSENVVHAEVIDWPNGDGYTPCSVEYRTAMDARDAIKAPGASLEDLTPEQYEEWMRLDNKLCEMHADGHVGQSVRWNKTGA